MQIEKLNLIVEPAVNGLGYELADLEVKQQGRSKLVRLFIDKPEGITLDDCESVSQQVSLILDVEDPITDDYVLEISSPGLNRTLKKLEHYQRFIGCEIRTRLHPSEDGRRNFRGKLLNATEDKINIEVDGEIYEINQESIEYTRLIPEI